MLKQSLIYGVLSQTRNVVFFITFLWRSLLSNTKDIVQVVRSKKFVTCLKKRRYIFCFFASCVHFQKRIYYDANNTNLKIARIDSGGLPWISERSGAVLFTCDSPTSNFSKVLTTAYKVHLYVSRHCNKLYVLLRKSSVVSYRITRSRFLRLRLQLSTARSGSGLPLLLFVVRILCVWFVLFFHSHTLLIVIIVVVILLSPHLPTS